MNKRFCGILSGIFILSLVLCGCTSEANIKSMAKEGELIETGFTVAEAGSYDSADTAVVVSIDYDSNLASFMNTLTGKQYTLTYDGTTYVMDKYGGSMVMAQISPGDIVDVKFLKGKKSLTSIQLSPEAWVLDNVDHYDLGGINGTAKVGQSTYALMDEAVIISEGRRAELMEIVEDDILTVSGLGHDIYSINIDRGHGYLRLSNENAVIGGWIEIGNSIITTISEDMLLTVPEGNYQVKLSYGSASTTKDVSIVRNKETVLDVSDLETQIDKTGKIFFEVDPYGAYVSVDGEYVDISKPVELSYGIHKVTVEADGYITLTKYIQVGSEMATISFVLEEGEGENEDTVSGNDSEDDVIGVITGNKVYIDGPEGVEVYQDDVYMGIAPVCFAKVTGSHTITLRKTGYISKSYTIYLYNDGQDITYSFTDLEPESSISGNDVTLSTSTTSTPTSTSTTSTSNTSTRVVSSAVTTISSRISTETTSTSETATSTSATSTSVSDETTITSLSSTSEDVTGSSEGSSESISAGATVISEGSSDSQSSSSESTDSSDSSSDSTDPGTIILDINP